MVFVGSKNRIAKNIIPIIESYITDETVAYIEPMGGGANIIDKINFHNKFYYDIHPQLVALLQHTQQTLGKDFPETISREEYYQVKNNQEQYEDWYVGLVGFCATYSSKYFGGHAGIHKDSNKDRTNEQIRNLIKQAPSLEGIKIDCKDFREIEIPDNSVIYCDPPYQGVTKYKGVPNFPYEEFYDWCRKQSKNNMVLVSEYNMPDDFKCIWSKEINCDMDSNRVKTTKKQEKLFILE